MDPFENPIKPNPTVVNPIIEKVDLEVHTDRSSSYPTLGAKERGEHIGPYIGEDKKPKTSDPKPKRGRS